MRLSILALILFLSVNAFAQDAPTQVNWEQHYKGKPDANAYYKAITYLDFQYGYRAEIQGNKLKLNFNFESGINPLKSWHKLDEIPTKAQKDQLLLHEQQHVNIHFLMAKEISTTLPNAKYSVSNYKKEIKKLTDSIKQKYQNIQEQYDKETAHGTKLREQLQWEERLEHALKSGGFSLHL